MKSVIKTTCSSSTLLLILLFISILFVQVDTSSGLTINNKSDPELSDGAMSGGEERAIGVKAVPLQAENGVSRAYDHLYTVMDKYHKTFDVYTDLSAAGNHFVMLGRMASTGSEDKVGINPGFKIDCYCCFSGCRLNA